MGELFIGEIALFFLLLTFSVHQVCLDIGEFDEVMTSYHRLMDLKNKYIDTEVNVTHFSLLICDLFLGTSTFS